MSALSLKQTVTQGKQLAWFRQPLRKSNNQRHHHLVCLTYRAIFLALDFCHFSNFQRCNSLIVSESQLVNFERSWCLDASGSRLLLVPIVPITIVKLRISLNVKLSIQTNKHKIKLAAWQKIGTKGKQGVRQKTALQTNCTAKENTDEIYRKKNGKKLERDFFASLHKLALLTWRSCCKGKKDKTGEKRERATKRFHVQYEFSAWVKWRRDESVQKERCWKGQSTKARMNTSLTTGWKELQGRQRNKRIRWADDWWANKTRIKCLSAAELLTFFAQREDGTCLPAGCFVTFDGGNFMFGGLGGGLGCR